MGNLIKIELDDISKRRIENLESLVAEMSTLIKNEKGYEEDRFLDKKEVTKMVCFSGTTLDDKVKEGLFPHPTPIFSRNRWKYSDVKKWMDDQWENNKKH